MIGFIKRFTKLEALYIRADELSVQAISAFIESITSLKRITVLSIRCMSIEAKGAMMLAGALTRLNKLVLYSSLIMELIQ
jgi:hypothetical protein